MVLRVPLLIQALAFSSNGDTFAAGFDVEDKVFVYDMKDTERPTTIQGEWVRAQSLAFSPNGRLLAFPDVWQMQDGKNYYGVRLWDYRKPSEMTKMSGHENFVTAIGFSSDGSMLVTGDEQGRVLLWDVTEGKLLRELAAHDDAVTAASFAPDGKHVVTASRDRQALICDTQNGKKVAALVGHEGWLLAVDIVDDGQTVLTGDTLSVVRRWEFPSGKLRETTVLKADGKRLGSRAMVFDRGGRLMATGEDSSNVVRVWDAKTGVERGAFQHAKLHQSTCLAFSPDGRTLVSGGFNEMINGLDKSEVRFWDLSKLTPKK